MVGNMARDSAALAKRDMVSPDSPATRSYAFMPAQEQGRLFTHFEAL
jgi:hypothetical protein